MNLQQFASPNPLPIFTDANTLPLFFQENLVDPARVVKGFINDPQAILRIFYYQYLKLCFESETDDYNQYIAKIEQTINNQGFKFQFYTDVDQSIYNDLTFKQLIMEFFGLLSQNTYSVEEAFAIFPIMDQVFIYFFRAFLILTDNCDSLQSYMNIPETIGFLSQQFNVQIQHHQKCIKFLDTDIFLYEENEQNVFMAYMDHQKLQQAESQQNLQSYEHIEPDPVVYNVQVTQNTPRQNAPIKSSYIEDQFVDYTGKPLPGQESNQTVIPAATVSTSVPQKNTNYEPSSITINAKVTSQISQRSDQSSSPSSLPLVSKLSSDQRTTSYGDLPLTSKLSTPYDPQAYLAKTKSQQNQAQKQQQFQRSASQKVSSIAPNFEKKYGAANELSTVYEVNSSLTSDPYNYSSIQSNLYNYKPQGKTQQNSYDFKKSYQAPVSQNNAFSAEISSLTHSTPSYQPSYNYGSSSGYAHPPTSTPVSYLASSNKQINNQYGSKGGYLDQITPKKDTFEAYKPQTQAYTPLINNVPVGKNPFGLNVSQQFTNSITMKSMSQPYRSNVYQIRQKARQFRNSLKYLMK